MFSSARLAVACMAAVTVMASMPALSLAQSFPTKPVVIIAPCQAGGSVDAIARPLAAKLAKAWGQPVIVENRPGTNGLIATQAVIKAAPDGHALPYDLTGIIQNPLIYKNVAYEPLSVVPVLQIGGQAKGLGVPGKSAIGSVDQLAADGKAKGAAGHADGSVGAGMTGHIWSELLASDRGFKASHAACKGVGLRDIDLVSDRLDWAFLSSAEATVRPSGRSVPVLAVTGPERVQQMSEVPTMRELGYPGFEMVGWHGRFAPPGTPSSTVLKFERDIRAAFADPDLPAVLDMQVIHKTSYGPDEFASVMRNDQARWASLIKRFNIQVN